MAQEKKCLRCGVLIPADSPEGLCPRCLMKVAMGEDAKVTVESSAFIEGPGTTIGRYKLLQLIGEGGMGLVYLAEQQEPIRRKAALKIVKLGMDTKQVIARFEAEKQMLALLEHPNIARVYDAGTTETGRPYFVMEYVKGQSITDYCDQHKANIEDRLKLFRQVCEGVHYAHQKGIIHRDIKPSNIVVTVEGDRAVPKIIDFGIAKAVTQPLTPGTLFTQQGQLLGTPEYMSPEQVDMATQDIDTRSDIYSLGVVLYQLLAGVLPFCRESFEKGGFAEIQRVIQEVDPPHPSTALYKLGDEAKKIAERRKTQVVPLARRLHRELEWIPLKAMRKERVRRYRSASELADDIQNYLNGNPLIAGPETAIYRVKKFVRRHTGSVATAVIIALVIIVGFIISTAMFFRAERARARAELLAAMSHATMEFFQSGFCVKRADVTVGEVVETLAKNLELLELRKGFSDSLPKDFHGVPLPVMVAAARLALGNMYIGIEKYEKAEPQLVQAHQFFQKALGQKHAFTVHAMKDLALLYLRQGRYDEAEPFLAKTLDASRRIKDDDHDEMLYHSVSDLSQQYVAEGRHNEAEPVLVRALEISRRIWGEENLHTTGSMWSLGRLYIKQGRYDDAEPLLVESLENIRRIQGEESRPASAHMNALGVLRTKQGRYDEAEPLLVKAVEIRTRLLGEEDPFVLEFMNDLAVLYREQGQYKEAEDLFGKALGSRQRVLGEKHPDTLTSMSESALLYVKQGRHDEAEPLAIACYQGRSAKFGPEHAFTQDAIQVLLKLYDAWGKPEKTEEWRAKLPNRERPEKQKTDR